MAAQQHHSSRSSSSGKEAKVVSPPFWTQMEHDNLDLDWQLKFANEMLATNHCPNAVAIMGIFFPA